jgi:hypothetical protein
MTAELSEDPSTIRSTLRSIATESFRYWEYRRLFYNAVLVLITVSYYFIGLPLSQQNVHLILGYPLLFLVAAANVLYCLVYLVDVPVRLSILRGRWLQWRWILFVLVTAAAAFMTQITCIAILDIWRY